MSFVVHYIYINLFTLICLETVGLSYYLLEQVFLFAQFAQTSFDLIKMSSTGIANV